MIQQWNQSRGSTKVRPNPWVESLSDQGCSSKSFVKNRWKPIIFMALWPSFSGLIGFLQISYPDNPTAFHVHPKTMFVTIASFSTILLGLLD
ncbi:transmembrane protein, putative [Medicago truncatula]|uniref:Transmembrane protein, putative n=1 Tax=Medicago truncatula TaxID=3880 RepID=G7L1L5_MEDTR|nr:transmembrane protein, putative [Medicago truncatula]